MGKKQKWLSTLGAGLLTIQLVSPVGTAWAAENNLLPPTNTAYEASTPDDGKLVWNAVYGATGYNIYEITDGQLIFLGTTKTNSYTLNNQAEGSKLYVVSTLSEAGESGPSAPFNVMIDYPALAAPTSLSNTIQNVNDIVLNWPASAHAEKYNVYKHKADGTTELLTTTTSRSYTIVNAEEGVHSYSVAATHTLYGESAKTTPLEVSVVYPVISEPKNIAFKLTNGNDLTLSWQSVSYANQYKVYSIINGEEVLQKTVTAPTVTFTNMPEGEYAYKVYAVSERFGSSDGSEVTATVSPVVMAKPSSFTNNIRNVNDVTLNWTAVPNANSYKLYQIIDGEKVLKGTFTTLTTTLLKLSGGDYTFLIHSYSDRFGESEEGASVQFNIETVTMESPANFTSKIENLNDIVLTWEASLNADSYKVYQVIDGQKVLKSTVTGTTTSFANQPSGEYEFVIASNSSRFGESTTTDSLKVTLDPVVIEKPTNFKVSVENGNDIALSWDAASNANNYRVYQLVNGVKVLKATVTGTNRTFTNLPEGEYKYVIHTYNSRFGESSEGSELTFNLKHPTMQSPNNATHEILTPTSIKLSWEQVEFATSYKVYLVTTNGKTLKGTYTGTTVSYSNLSPGEYKYEIHAYSGRFGESQLGSSLIVVVEGQVMEAPNNFKSSITNGNDINLSWDAVQYATNYKIYKVTNGEKVLLQTTSSSVRIATYTNQPEGNYHYEVTSFSTLLGESPTAEVIFTLEHPEMANPSNFTATVQNIKDIKLTWSSVPFANNYKVYELRNGQEVLIGTYTTTSAILSDVTEGTHIYKIRSNSIRFGESVESSSANAEVVYPNIQPPTSLTHTILNGNDIKLNWTAAQNATNYRIYKVKGEERELLRTVTGTTTTFPNQPEGDYHYEVVTYSNLYGESLGSTLEVSVAFPLMDAPDNLTNTVIANDITLNWSSIQYATGYNIYELVNGTEVFKKTVTGTMNKFMFVSEGTHEYVVRSYSDRFGESKEGNKVEVTITYPVINAPTNFNYTILTGNNIKLSWSEVAQASGYKIFQVVDGQRVYKGTVSDLFTTFTNMPEGEYTFEVQTVTTRYGDSKDTSKVSFELVHPDMQPPVDFVKSITNGNDIGLSWKPSTYANSYRIYKVKNGEKVLLETTTGTSLSFVNQPEGDYRYEVHSYSSRFGESKEASILAFELVHPTLEAPTKPSYSITAGNDINLNWGSVLYDTGYKIYRIVDGEKVFVQSTSAMATKFTNMPEGNYEYVIHAYSNRFGESPTGTTINFDLKWPVVQPAALNGSVFNANNVELTWNKTDYTDEYRVYEIKGENKELVYKGKLLTTKIYNLTEEKHSYQVVSYSNRFGEHAFSNITVYDIVYPVMESPAANAKVLDAKSATISWNFITYANGYNIYEVEDEKTTLIAERVNNLSYTLQDLTYKNHYYYVTSYSNSFGESDPSDTVMVKLISDTLPPVTTSDYSKGWKNKSQVITLSATDDESGVDKTFYSLNGGSFVEGATIAAEAEGKHELSFYSIDKTGNKEVVKAIEVQIDKTAPVTIASEIPTNWVNRNVLVSLVSEDTLSGVAKTYYSINGEDFVEGSSFTLSKEGVNQISYYSVDNAGNKEEVRNFEVKMDKTAPVTAVTKIPSGSNESVTVSLISEDDLSGVAKTYYSINDRDYTEGSSFKLDDEGVNKVTYYSVDQAGNAEETKSFEVEIDKTAPVTTITDVPGEWVKEDVTITLTAKDNLSGVGKTFYSINGSEFEQGEIFTISTEGINKITYYSIDNAGNKEEVKTAVVNIDMTVPVTDSNITGEWKSEDVTVTFTSSDDLSGVTETFYSVNGSEFMEGKTIVITKEGINQVSYYSVDAAGNNEAVKTKEVKIDKTVPELAVTLEGEYALGSHLNISYTSKDLLSGVASESFVLKAPGEVYGKTVNPLVNMINLDKPGVYTLTAFVIDHAGNIRMVEKQFTVYINAFIEVTPGVIKGNNGVFTVRVDLPSGFTEKDLNLDTAKLNGVDALKSNKGYFNQAKNGQFKFERSDFKWTPGEETLEFRCYVNGYLVVGHTTVTVK